MMRMKIDAHHSPQKGATPVPRPFRSCTAQSDFLLRSGLPVAIPPSDIPTSKHPLGANGSRPDASLVERS